jgi:hypothetical protein
MESIESMKLWGGLSTLVGRKRCAPTRVFFDLLILGSA